MSVITTIQATDVVADSRAVINANFAALNADKVETLSDLGLTENAAAYNAVATSFSLVPTGAITAWPVTVAPSGWLRCEGQAISRTTFATLFALIGTTYGAGDGSTTFNLPNLQGRVPVGRDALQTEFDTLGETGGAKTHTLTIAEMPSHNHRTRVDNSGSGTESLVASPDSGIFSNDDTRTDNEGGGGAHNNLQPYIVLNYIIKT